MTTIMRQVDFTAPSAGEPTPLVARRSSGLLISETSDVTVIEQLASDGAVTNARIACPTKDLAALIVALSAFV